MTDGLTKYERIEKSLHGLPMTWYPALLARIIESGYDAGTWVDGRASDMARRIEARYGHCSCQVTREELTLEADRDPSPGEGESPSTDSERQG